MEKFLNDFKCKKIEEDSFGAISHGKSFPKEYQVRESDAEALLVSCEEDTKNTILHILPTEVSETEIIKPI